MSIRVTKIITRSEASADAQPICGGDKMTQASPKSPKCAFCKRWDGDAKLTNQGVAKGFIRFDDSVRAVCLANQARNTKRANEGSGCKDYAISPTADRFV